jgi:hypothetical protein
MLYAYIAGIKATCLVNRELDGSFCPRSKVNLSLGSPTLSFTDHKFYSRLYLTHRNTKVTQNLGCNSQLLSRYSQ